VQRLRALQAEILHDYSRMVKPGGKLVYATCSIFRSENEDQVQAFLQEHGSEWTLEEEMRLHPGDDGGDGFYAARLLRHAVAK
jgi:16S rRNA (cytosine967-C5)-methyltransferase